MMRALALACFIALVLCGRLCVVFYAGSPIPFHDQWSAEAHGIFIPYFRHELSFGSLFVTHGDHVIALTRAIDLGLVILEGKWDCLSQMVINCVISPFCLFPLMYWAAVQYSARLMSVLCLVVGVVYGSPLFYGNIVWGFQSQILLMIALSVAHLYFVVVRPGGWVRWCLAMTCGLLAAISFGSGFLAAIISSLALLSSWRRLKIGGTFLFATLAGCGGIVGLALWLAPAHPMVKDVHFSTMVRTFVQAFSFPARLFSYWGFLFWIPAAGSFVLGVLNREWATRWLFPLAAAAWCLAQIAIISAGRSAVAPRYYDIFMVGVLANGCLAIGLLKYPWPLRAMRNAVVVGFALWSVGIGYKTIESTAEHTKGDVPVLTEHATQQVALVARYYAEQRDPEILRSSAFPIRPWPEVNFLDDTLRQPEISSLWPSYVLRWRPNDQLRGLPWIGERITRESWFRGSLFGGVVALVSLYVIVLWALLEKRRCRDDLRAGA